MMLKEVMAGRLEPPPPQAVNPRAAKTAIPRARVFFIEKFLKPQYINE
jgi:hypothetical protein